MLVNEFLDSNLFTLSQVTRALIIMHCLRPHHAVFA